MKRLLSLFIIGIFLVSLMPSVLAEGYSEGDSNKNNDHRGNIVSDEGNNGLDNAVTTSDENKGKGIDNKKLVTKRLKRLKKEIRKIRGVKAEDIRNFQKEMLMVAIDKCKEKGIDVEKCERTLKRRVELVKKLKEKDLKRLNRISKKKLEKIKGFMELRKEKEFRKFKKNGFKARIVAKEKYKLALERYNKAKKTYLDIKERYVKKSKAIRKLKNELKGLTGDEYKEKEGEIKEKVSEFLVDVSDMILKHLEMVKERVESNEDLSEEEVSEILEKIKEEIAKVEKVKEEALSLTSESSKEEIREVAKELKEVWLDLKPKVKRAVGRVVNARIGGIIVRSKHLENRLNRILERMVEEGKDISELEPLIEKFNGFLDEAKENYKKARELFNDGLVREGHEYMKEAHKALKEANKALKEIFKELKNENMEEELEEDEVSEVEEEAEEELVEEAEEE